MSHPNWYHCPLCEKDGYASMFGDGCTDCSNKRLFNLDGTHKIPHPMWDKERIAKWLNTLPPVGSLTKKKPWYRQIQFFWPWNSLYLGIQFRNCTWFLFRVRRIPSPKEW